MGTEPRDVARREDGGGIIDDLRPGAGVEGVMGADPLPCAAFHQHAMAMRGQFMHALRRDADAIFVILDLSDGAYDHDHLLHHCRRGAIL